jgi:hypothetical protein
MLSSFSAVSKTVCIEHTLQMVRVLSLQNQRFEAIRSPQAQLQHIGTAVSTLISAVAISKDFQERAMLLESLYILAELARAISPTYAPAEMISEVLDNVLEEQGWNQNPSTSMEPGKDMRDFTNNVAHSKDDFFNNLMVSDGGTHPVHSMEDPDRALGFPFEQYDTLNMLSRFGEASWGFTSPEALASALTGASASTTQQTTGYEQHAQTAYAPHCLRTLSLLNADKILDNSRGLDQISSENSRLDAM